MKIPNLELVVMLLSQVCEVRFARVICCVLSTPQQGGGSCTVHTCLYTKSTFRAGFLCGMGLRSWDMEHQGMSRCLSHLSRFRACMEHCSTGGECQDSTHAVGRR